MKLHYGDMTGEKIILIHYKYGRAKLVFISMEMHPNTPSFRDLGYPFRFS